jgi:hypothetical protein
MMPAACRQGLATHVMYELRVVSVVSPSRPTLNPLVRELLPQPSSTHSACALLVCSHHLFYCNLIKFRNLYNSPH